MPHDATGTPGGAGTIKRIAAQLLILWAALVAILLAYEIKAIYHNAREVARESARAVFNKDTVYRRWATMHGGVYAPATDRTPPNPHLSHIPERDIRTPSGKLLTLMNPAYMTRQVHELGAAQYGAQGHITSLNPIRPENRADEWETAALGSFSRSVTETTSIEIMNGQHYMRHMKPFFVEEGCLKCHAAQGYKLGDIRGGISVSIPMRDFWAIAGERARASGIAFTILLAAGFGLILAGRRRILNEALERAGAEAALAKSEERFSMALDGVNDGIFEWDLDTGAMYLSTKCFTMLEYKPGAFPGTIESVKFLVHPDESKEFSELVRQVTLGEKDSYAAEVRMKTSSGGWRWILCRGGKSGDGGGAAGKRTVFGTHVDITGRKMTEREIVRARAAAEAASRAKSVFLANMSHEIRTPMNGVLGFAKLLSMSGLNSEQGDFCRNILASGNNLLRIISDILDFSKIEAGRMTVEEAPFFPARAVFEAFSIFEPAAAARKLGYSLDCGIDEKAALRGDEVRIKQIISNIIGNAVKFTESGEVTVKARLLANSPNASTLAVTVTDTGVGIAPEKIGRIFDAFEQADASSTKRFAGTGLGLSIVRKLLELLGGTIRVESEQGKGSKFSVEIPLRSEGSAETQARPREEAAGKRTTAGAGRLRILLAEDDPFNSALIAKMMERSGWDCDAADSGGEALEMFASRDYDVVLLDIQMPDMDGFQTARTIREREKASGRRVPIFAVTAYAREQDEIKCLESGMDEFIPKPVMFEDLVARVLKHAGKR